MTHLAVQQHPLKPDYELLDFGGGRKLERFGSLVLNRPSPAAEPYRISDPRQWRAADYRYDRQNGTTGCWSPKVELSAPWLIRLPHFVLRLSATKFGHIGLFPEQQENWTWIYRQVQRARRPLRVP